MAETWLVCSEPSCRTAIAFGAKHWVCSVSTCNRSRTRLVFCSVVCWDAHLGEARHRDAGAIESHAPSKEAWQRELASEGDSPKRPQTPPQGVRPSPTVTARPANVVGSRPPTHETTQPIRTVEPARGPAPTSDSVQARTSAASPSPPQAQPVRTPTAAPAPAPARRVVGMPPAGDGAPALAASMEGVHLADIVDRDILIVVSKLKKYIKDRSGMNCSDAIVDVLSDHVRVLCDDAIRAAARDERKTVLERDIVRPRR